MSLNSTFLQSLLSLDFDIGRVGLYLTNCIKLLIQAAWGHLGLHYAKKTSGKEPKLADLVWGPLYHTAPLITMTLRDILVPLCLHLGDSYIWALYAVPLTIYERS